MWKGNMWKEHVEINIGKETCEKKHTERKYTETKYAERKHTKWDI